MSEIWLSSDLHFHHKNIIDFCSRPFGNVSEMNESLIEWHNTYVKPEDKWWFLGDFTMERDPQGIGLSIASRLNGHKRIILGNHDHYTAEQYLVYFEKVCAMNRIDNIEFTHFPIHPGSLGSAKANVHGHIHNKPDYDPFVRVRPNGSLVIQPYINVSIEVTAYRPLSLGEVKERINRAIEAYKEAHGESVRV